MPPLLLNLAYCLMLAALLVRDVFRLRILLAASQLSFIGYALLAENFSMTAWNTGFVIVNLAQAVRLLRMRKPITLSPELEDIYSRAFSRLSRREFLYFWRTGRPEKAEGSRLVKSGTGEGKLYFITAGTVSIIRDGKEVTRIGRGDFIADSSTILEEYSAVVDARAVGPVRCTSWDKDSLENLQQVAPELFIKLQKIISGYMTKKLRAALDG